MTRIYGVAVFAAGLLASSACINNSAYLAQAPAPTRQATDQ